MSEHVHHWIAGSSADGFLGVVCKNFGCPVKFVISRERGPSYEFDRPKIHNHKELGSPSTDARPHCGCGEEPTQKVAIRKRRVRMHGDGGHSRMAKLIYVDSVCGAHAEGVL